MISDGVKGVLIARREILVVCALSSLAESRRTWSGLGAFSRWGVVVVEAALREDVNWWRRD